MVIKGYIFNIMAERISYNIRVDYFWSILTKDIAFFDDDDHLTGDLSK